MAALQVGEVIAQRKPTSTYLQATHAPLTPTERRVRGIAKWGQTVRVGFSSQGLIHLQPFPLRFLLKAPLSNAEVGVSIESGATSTIGVDMAAERFEGTREVSSLALPPQPREPQPQRWQRQRPKRRAPSSARQDNGEITRHPRSSIKVSPCSAGSSRPVPARSLRLQRNPVGSVLMLLAAAILAVPSARPWVGGKIGWGIGAQAQPCVAVSSSSVSGELVQITVSNDTELDLSTVFACEGGKFNVSWSGIVEVNSTIKIGNGTTVRIFGETTTSSGANSSISGGNTSRYSSYYSNSSRSGVDLEFELERLSSDLNLPQGLASEAVGVFSAVPFGPVFLVDGGELHLESICVRGGNATVSTANAIMSGGGVSAINSNVSVSGCVFEDNFAKLSGGGIRATLSTLTVKDSVFRGNHAGFRSYAGDEDEDVEGAGGGIACETITLSVDGCLFDDNYASKKGGGVHIDNGQVSIVDSLFFNNLAGSNNDESEGALGEGAGLFFTECTGSFDGLSPCGVNDTVFIYNAAAKKGAAVAVGSGNVPSFIEFHRCLIHNSTTGWPFEDDPQGDGGGFTLGKRTTTILEDCVVTDNYCGNKGAAVYLSSGDSWDYPGATIIMRNSAFVNNIAELDSAGAIYLSDYASALIEGDHNNFTGNICGINGGVLAATSNTNVTVEGGWFEGNKAGEGGGVFWVKGELTITGGNFYENVGSQKGGVVKASEDGFVNVSSGNFVNNEAYDGGAVYVGQNSVLYVHGGVFTENLARNGGGAISKEDGGDTEITGGNFTKNSADFGGFMFMENEGITSCAGASVVGNEAIDGGAIYAVDEAVIEWACDLVENEALVGPAIYTRARANITLRDMIISDNIIARGSVVFIVNSTVHAYQVEFADTSESPDLSAVQSDGKSTFVAEGTAFIGFQGETVVYSEGTLYLDDCDFRESSASVLVYSESGSTTVVRNTILGDKNFKTAIQEYSDASEIPVNASLINVDLSCSESGSPCSSESTCLKGDLGVYCHCYTQYSTSEEICMNGHPEGLTLTVSTHPPITFYPDLLEGDIVVSLDASGSRTSTSASMSTVETTSRQSSGAVVWNMSALPRAPINWTVFPSVGILRPGNNITVRVVSRPDPQFDGVTEVTFSAESIGATQDSQSNVSSTGSSWVQAPSAAEDSGGVGVAVQEDMNVTFYHCREGNFWNLTSSSDGDDATCKLCTDSAEGDTEGLNCEALGTSTLNLPIEGGYWRASLESLYIRECFNEDACSGGSDVESVNNYCSKGYEGPYCGVCAQGYGRGSSNSCHECTAELQGIMLFVFAVAVVISIIVIILLGAYLVGGRVTVSKTMSTTRQSVSRMRRRGSGLVLSTELRARPNLGASASSVGDGSARGSSKRYPANASTTSDSRPGTSRGGLAGGEVAMMPAAGEKTDDGREAQEGDSEVGGEKDDGVDEVSVSASWSTSPSASASALRAAPESASAFVLLPEPASASADEEEKGGGRVRSFLRRIGRAPVEERRRNETAAVQSRGGGDVGGGSAGDTMHGSGTGRGLGRGEGKRRHEGPDEKEKTAAAVIGEVLGRLPLSKLKIVIVVWQISNAFADVTEVPFPEVYDKFLSFIGIFSFDLSWILSAACISVGLDFYDELLIVTIGPVFLLGLLGLTFCLGASPVRSTRRDLSSAAGTSSSGVTFASTITGTSKRKADGYWGWAGRPERGAGATSAVSGRSSGRFLLASSEGGGEGRYDPSRCRSSTTSMVDGSTMFVSAATAAAVVLETAAGDLNVTSSADFNSAEGGAQSGAEEPPTSAGPESRGLGHRRPSVRSIWKDGPGEDPNSEQNYLWRLFARHTTMTLIILYLVYSSVSTIIFQAFACENLKDIDKIYLRADFRIECDTPRHTAYEIYAAVMIFVYPLGIPAAFLYFLARQKSSINPIIDKDVKDQRGADHVTREKERIRKDDPTIAPTSFLWSPYYPDRYYFEVFECMRRLLLTGILVFLAPDTSGQVAYSCLFAFLSLVGFEMLRPHTDQLDRILYRTGSMIIFFANFLALMIKAEVTDRTSNNATLYSLGLIIVNIFFVLSVWWNTWATTMAVLSQKHMQGILFGVTIVEEDKVDAVVDAAMEENKRKSQSTAGGEVKIEDVKAGSTWDCDPSVVEEPVGISTSTRYNPGAGNDYIEESITTSSTNLKPSTAGAVEGSLNVSEPLRRKEIVESGPRRRVVPDVSTCSVPTRSARKYAQSPAAATAAAGSEEDHSHA